MLIILLFILHGYVKFSRYLVSVIEYLLEFIVLMYTLNHSSFDDIQHIY